MKKVNVVLAGERSMPTQIEIQVGFQMVNVTFQHYGNLADAICGFTDMMHVLQGEQGTYFNMPKNILHAYRNDGDVVINNVAYGRFANRRYIARIYSDYVSSAISAIINLG